MSIRERDAAYVPDMLVYRSDIFTYAEEASRDRRTLLAALDALVEAVDREFPESPYTANDENIVIDGYTFWRLRHALARAEEATDGR